MVKCRPAASRILLWSVILLASIGILNIAVDPYYLFASPNIRGINKYKPAFFFQLGMTKPYQFVRSNASAVIIGSSRAGSGFNPSYGVLSNQGVYNLAVPGARIRQIDQSLRSAVASGGVKRAIICLDLFGFNSHGDLPPIFADALQNRFTQNQHPLLDGKFLHQAVMDYSGSLFAYKAIYDSVDTLHRQPLFEQNKNSYFQLHDDGHWSIHFAEDRNVLQAFRNAENSYLNGNWFPQSDHTFSFETYSGLNPFDVFAKMLDFAYSNNVEVTLVLMPVHARMLETMDQAGLWPYLEEWKKRLVMINTRQAQLATTEPYALWDFLAYSRLTMEAIGDKTTSEEVVWMYDSSHTSYRTGNRIAEIIMGAEPRLDGKKLEVTNVTRWLVFQQQQQQQYRSQHQEQFAEIGKRVARHRNKNSWQVEPLTYSIEQ
ncbi:hypothetical protein [Halioxenophilus sp. WMMB6]|uniref:hypothetical protein n=1 Tax=Halioxenophilus sp. WMMB6 TaxID=3073815 RepID=UPI00295E7E84|nr:hypothetical protein [Halioxenophilus sp. WMMB6]